MITNKRQLVSFDWALKNLLRNKGNFCILEGFLSELLKEDLKIQEILDSESNKKHAADKHNRVDLLVKDQEGKFIIIEVQYENQTDYLQRILYGTSKIITDNIFEGTNYTNVKKIISVSIVYFDLGEGEDYIYKGTTEFVGIHKKDLLKLSDEQKNVYGVGEVHKIFPEYYILKINKYDDIVRDKFDEWIYFLKNEKVKRNFAAKGIKKAAETLSIIGLSPEKQREFEIYKEESMDRASWYQDTVVYNFNKGKLKGEQIGIKKGEKIGIEKGEKIGIEKAKRELIKKMKQCNISLDKIAEVTGITKEEIEKL